MKLSKDLIKRIEEITLTDYSFNSEGETDKWDILVEDLLLYYNDLEEEFEDYKAKMEDRYAR